MTRFLCIVTLKSKALRWRERKSHLLFFVDAAFLPAVRMNDGALSVFLCVILFSIKLFPALARI